MPLAHARAGANGLRLGILDNTKWNANRLLRKAAAVLEEESRSPRSTTTARRASRRTPSRR